MLTENQSVYFSQPNMMTSQHAYYPVVNVAKCSHPTSRSYRGSFRLLVLHVTHNGILLIPCRQPKKEHVHKYNQMYAPKQRTAQGHAKASITTTQLINGYENHLVAIVGFRLSDAT